MHAPYYKPEKNICMFSSASFACSVRYILIHVLFDAPVASSCFYLWLADKVYFLNEFASKNRFGFFCSFNRKMRIEKGTMLC